MSYTKNDWTDILPAAVKAKLDINETGTKYVNDERDKETAPGRALVEAETVADQRTALELGDSATKNVGTSAGTVAAGDDARLPTALEKTRLSDIQAATGATTAEKITALVPAASPTVAGKNTLGASGGAIKETRLPDGDASPVYSKVDGSWATVDGWAKNGNTCDVTVSGGRLHITPNGTTANPSIFKSIAGTTGKILRLTIVDIAEITEIRYHNGTTTVVLPFARVGGYIIVDYPVTTSSATIILYFYFASAEIASGKDIAIADIVYDTAVFARGSVSELAASWANLTEKRTRLGADFVDPTLGKQFKILGCILRNTGTGWALVSTTGHVPLNATGAITSDATKITLNYGFTAKNLVTFHVTPDETFAQKGIFIGASVDLPNATIYLSRIVALHGKVYYNGSAWVKSGDISSVAFDAGKLTITHASLGTAEGLVSTSLVPSVSLECAGGTRPDIYPENGAITDTTSEIYLYDAAGALITTPTTDMILYWNRGGLQNIDPSTLVSASGNIWVSGIFEVN